MELAVPQPLPRFGPRAPVGQGARLACLWHHKVLPGNLVRGEKPPQPQAVLKGPGGLPPSQSHPTRASIYSLSGFTLIIGTPCLHQGQNQARGPVFGPDLWSGCATP